MTDSTHPHSCESVIAVADEPHHHLVVDNEWVRAYAVEIGPRKNTLCHLHSLPYLLYVAGEAEIVSAPKEGDARKHHYPDAYCEFAPAGLEHVVKNLADTTFRNLVFELRPEAAKLRRRGPGFASAAGVRNTPLYSGRTICAELINLGSGSQTEIAGPAVVATPYENSVELIVSELGTRKLRHFRDLEYVPGGSAGLLRCEAGEPARLLVVTLGQT